MRSPSTKIRVLVVHSQLAQHGSERYLYEVCKALDKNRFEVSILTRPVFIRNQFYYHKLTELGLTIHCKLITRRHIRFPIKKLYARLGWMRRLVGALQQWQVRLWCGRLVRSADVVAIIGIETYCDAFAPWLDESGNVVIHHMNHKFQFERDYFNECRQRRVVILDEQQRLEVKASPMADCEMFYFPLSMSLNDRAMLSVTPPATGRLMRFAVVSRLYKDRPNEPLFRCFAALARAVPAELYFYGGGDASQYALLLGELKIVDKVRFMGHQSNLEAALLRDRPAVLWLIAMGPSISYGSVEVASLGLPMVFWNLSRQSYEQILAQTDGALHAFADEASFVDFNLKLLQDPVRLKEHAEHLCRHVRSRFEISHYISSLEDYYETVACASDVVEPNRVP